MESASSSSTTNTKSPNSSSAGFITDQLPHTSEDDEASVDQDIIQGDQEEQSGEQEHGEDHNSMEDFGENTEDRSDEIMEDRSAALDASDVSNIADAMQRSPVGSQRGHSGEDVPMTDETEDDQDDDELEDEALAEYNMYHIKGTLKEWVTRDEVRFFIAKKFKEFLNSHVNPKKEHRGKNNMCLINEMVSASKCSLELDYKEFIDLRPSIAIWLADVPQSVLEVMEEATESFVFELHPNYRNVHQKIYLRITEFPIHDEIRNLRQKHLNTIIRIGGVVTRRTGVLPQLDQVKYDCNKCGAILGPFFQNRYSEVKVGSCPECRSKGPFTTNIEQTATDNISVVQ